MISFQPTAEEEAFVTMAIDFAKEKIRPQARDCEEKRTVTDKLVHELNELGFLSLELPEYLEGLELPLVTQVQILKALSFGDLGIVQGLRDAGDAASCISLLQEDKIIGLGQPLTEMTLAFIDNMKRDLVWENTFQTTETDEGFILNGTTEPVRLAQFADGLFIGTITENGIPIILFSDKSSGWLVDEGDYRLGLLASGIGKIRFNDVHIPKEYVFAQGEEAEQLLEKVRTRVMILQAAKQVGLMEAAVDYATEYTAVRKAFGQEIAKFQGVSFRIAKMVMETRVANHLTLEAAWRCDERDEEAENYALRALYRAHRGVRFVTDSAVQLLGGHGYIQEFPVEKWMRDAQAQVALYGRERDYLIQRGEKLLAQGEGVTTR